MPLERVDRLVFPRRPTRPTNILRFMVRVSFPFWRLSVGGQHFDFEKRSPKTQRKSPRARLCLSGNFNALNLFFDPSGTPLVPGFLQGLPRSMSEQSL